ncbi:MAG: hypothetical protein JRG96_04810 [Deltaproteobacteria bacterium]|nr:hypothetical protein [Deltaproteobacteria bacterium]MBW2418183.1 hypothetical protein [Deltaproteobacteria bacterium]
MRTTVCIALLCWLALACGGAPDKLSDCIPADGVTPICGLQNPEDLAVLPGGEWLIVSQMAEPGGSSGSLVGLRIVDGEVIELFPAAGSAAAAAAARHPTWGAADCPGPPDAAAFAPHGIDLHSDANGDLRLAVVRHGGREAIELFEITTPGGRPSLTWRGCVETPPKVWANDVVALANGGLMVTKMMSSSEFPAALPGLVRILLGRETGGVYEWRREAGWRELEGGRGSGPNGIAVDSAAGEVYFSEWGSRRLTRLRPDGAGGWQRDSVALPHNPDNLSWSESGALLVAGQSGGVGDAIGCGSVEGGTCALPFSIVEVDPRSLETRVLLDHPATATGAASSVVEVDGEFFIGTFAGDRIGRFSRVGSPMPGK